MGRANARKKAKKRGEKKASKLRTEANVIATTKTITLPRRGQNQTTASRKEPKERREQESTSDEDSNEGDIAKSPAAGTRANKKRGAVGLPEPTPPKQERRTSKRSAEKAKSKEKASSAVKPRKAVKPKMAATVMEDPDGGVGGGEDGDVVRAANGAADVEEAGGVDAESDNAESNGESDGESNDDADEVAPSSSPKRKRDAMTPRVRVPKRRRGEVLDDPYQGIDPELGTVRKQTPVLVPSPFASAYRKCPHDQVRPDPAGNGCFTRRCGEVRHCARGIVQPPPKKSENSAEPVHRLELDIGHG